MTEATYQSNDTAGRDPDSLFGRVVPLDINRIRPDPRNERGEDLDADLDDLVNSLGSVGMIEPIQVYPNSEGGYTIRQGHRRWAAAQALGWTEIAANIVEPPKSEAARDMLRLAPNEVRTGVDPVLRARTIARMLETEGRTQREIGAEMGRGQSWVAEQLRLLELPEVVLKAISARRLSSTHGLRLLKITEAEVDYQGNVTRDVDAVRLAFAQRVLDAVDDPLSVNQLDSLILSYLSNQAKLRQNAAILAGQTEPEAAPQLPVAELPAPVPSPSWPVAAGTTPEPMPFGAAPAVAAPTASAGATDLAAAPQPAPQEATPRATPPPATPAVKPTTPTPQPRPAPTATTAPAATATPATRPTSFEAATVQIAITLQPAAKDGGRSVSILGRTEAGLVSQPTAITDPAEVPPLVGEVLTQLRGQYGPKAGDSEQPAAE